MPDMISFSLPEMPRIGDDENIDVKKVLKQIQNYMYLLTEQMKFYLNNIDADNFNDAYAEKVAGVLGKMPSGSQVAPYKAFVKSIEAQIDAAKEQLNEAFKVGEKGYLVLNDSQNDGVQDEYLIIDTPEVENAMKVWRWNVNGLGFSNTGYHGNYTIGILPDGRILASGIIGDYIKGLQIEGGTIKGGYIYGAEGNIGGWTFKPDSAEVEGETVPLDGKIFQRRVMDLPEYRDNSDYMYTYEFTLKSDTRREQDKKAVYSNRFRPAKRYINGQYEYQPINSDTTDVEFSDGTIVSVDPDDYKEEQFFIRRNGEYYTPNDIFIGKKNAANEPSISNSYTVISGLNGIKTTNQLSIYSAGGGLLVGLNKDGIEWWPSGVIRKHINEATETTEQTLDTLDETQRASVKVFAFGDDSSVSVGYDDFPDKSGQEEKGFLKVGSQYISNYEWNGNTNYLQIGSRGHRANNAKDRVAIIAGNINNSSTAPLYITSGGTLTLSSSARKYKKNITERLNADLNPALLYELKVKQFDYKKKFKSMAVSEGKQLGFIADDVARIFPAAAIFNGAGEVESWQERVMIPAMLALVQKQKGEIDELKEMLFSQQDEINELKKLVKG